MKKVYVKVIDDFLVDQKEKGRSIETVKKYNSILQQFSSWVDKQGGDVNDLTRVDVQNYINHLINVVGNSATTIENKFAVLSLFSKYVGRPHVVEQISRPKTRKAMHRAPKSLDRNERNRVLREVERSGNLRNIAISYLFLYTGLRVSELVDLDQDDIMMSERRGSVIVGRGKGDIERIVPLPQEARFHLKRYLQDRNSNIEALFVSYYRKSFARITVRAVQKLLQKYDIHPHQLRHTYCRELVGSGVDIATVAELAGHGDINVTRRYSKPSDDELEQAVQKTFG
ncbi:integrase/recombinase XerD [Croceifilum oryzae]|uniref:Integrase/recombinase XerD n=1 Tax=Croceifilum oryzae TaxID=1553429 RepID=A0AAJ1TLK9_9BACL|nr:tyrosine-type recombinase/integrase [Croceifilum oryzae]MDQ0418772.1 integrase/recombinase XerD [Croceifilum oryzae]